ncbi:hypothetical protein MACH09_46120 [Vibrio sp. MACH09]|uniref:helix-turn-helix domain-containing protein n=1 Tax=Vibrio sp. MACH09 TaxID=3025122 RepID=UPI00278C93E0|nr:helix-turn-helix transcriptional regulator [Vibrio sp. MACH09]GLO64104.1 hypothetical protein MACH09_46120 [Vibrio sp. MACH09]
MANQQSKDLIRNKLKLAVENSKLSKSEIARRVGVTRASVQFWIRTGDISKDNLIAVCQLLHLNISEMLSTDDSVLDLAPLQLKVIQLTKELPKEHYYKLEDIVRILEDDSE